MSKEHIAIPDDLPRHTEMSISEQRFRRDKTKQGIYFWWWINDPNGISECETPLHECLEYLYYIMGGTK